MTEIYHKFNIGDIVYDINTNSKSIVKSYTIGTNYSMYSLSNGNTINEVYLLSHSEWAEYNKEVFEEIIDDLS